MGNKLVAPVIGPRNTSPQRFEEWFASENFEGMPLKEVAQLAFDAGHAFWHEIEDKPKEN